MKKKLKILAIFLIVVIILYFMLNFISGIIYKNKMKEISKFSSSEMIDYTLKNNKNAIISIAVYDENGITYNVYGAEYNLNFDYEIGSITKTFTAMLISKAIDEGRINLDDNISNYLELENRYYPTIEEIITHTSGLR